VGTAVRLTRIAVAIVAAVAFANAAAAAGRVALVIGNSAYQNVDRLPNPERDARAVAAALERIDFDSVTLRIDLDQTGMRRALGEFAAIAAGADVALLYYAGHGIEVSGQNYLVPTDARLNGASDVDFETVDLTTATAALERAAGLKLLILDACRDNPFRSRMQQGGGTRSISRGLARVEPNGRDIVVAYAAREGTTAADGEGTNSPYTAALLKHIGTPGLDVRLLFGKVRDDVVAATGGEQEPYIYESLGGDVLSLARADATAVAPAGPEQSSVDREALYWSSVKDSSDPAIIQSYLDRYPDGEFAILARAKLASLGAPAETPAAEEPPVSTVAPGVEAFQKAQAADAAGDLAGAARLYQQAADAGHARAMALLSYAYEYGRGVGQSNDKAFDLFSRAAAAGDVQGKFSLAWAFDQGKMTTPDPVHSGQLFLEVLRSGENAAFYAKVISDFHTGLKPATMKVIQEGLKQDGRYEGAVDGAFGPSTERALKSFGEG
jgi:uncharacterized caspase-like protein/peptidoglycan hydrolase-like protein with peptidoglycan-binding domain